MRSLHELFPNRLQQMEESYLKNGFKKNSCIHGHQFTDDQIVFPKHPREYLLSKLLDKVLKGEAELSARHCIDELANPRYDTWNSQRIYYYFCRIYQEIFGFYFSPDLCPYCTFKLIDKKTVDEYIDATFKEKGITPFGEIRKRFKDHHALDQYLKAFTKL